MPRARGERAPDHDAGAAHREKPISGPRRRRGAGSDAGHRIDRWMPTSSRSPGSPARRSCCGRARSARVELVDLYLERIERSIPALNAFTDVFSEQARAAAVEADERLAAGDADQLQRSAPLLGVPVALKDEIEVEGLVAQHGTCAYSEPAAADAAHWRRLKDGRRDPARQDDAAGAGDLRLHRVGDLGRDPQPVEHRPHDRAVRAAAPARPWPPASSARPRPPTGPDRSGSPPPATASSGSSRSAAGSASPRTVSTGSGCR